MTPEPTKPQKSGPSPVVIVLAIFAALMMTCAGGIYMFTQSEQGQKLVQGATEMISIVTEAQSAPGTTELRDLGCDEAMVMDIDRMMKILESMGATDKPDLGEGIPENTLMVLCQMSSSSRGPSCGEIASTYAAAANAEKPFMVLAGERNDDEDPECQALYDKYGEQLTVIVPDNDES